MLPADHDRGFGGRAEQGRGAHATSDNFYQLFSRPFGLIRPPGLMVAVVPSLVAAGWLLLRRLPDGAAGQAAVRPPSR